MLKAAQLVRRQSFICHRDLHVRPGQRTWTTLRRQKRMWFNWRLLLHWSAWRTEFIGYAGGCALKEIIEVPVLSDAVRRLNVPVSLVTRANGMVYVSGTPPLDIPTGHLVKGDIAVQTEASLSALAHCLKAAGSSLDKV